MAASSSFGPECSSTCTAVTVAPPVAPRSGTGAGDDLGRAAAGTPRRRSSSGGTRRGTGLAPVNVVVTSVLPPKIGVGDGDRVAVDGDVDVVREHRAVELDRQAG